ncbi:MAG: PP2C family protein-serine/threonine phosphatase [Candidatus Acidiferrum sp.]
MAGTWQPARVVGGDYFDVLKFSESKIGVCIGDVVGKGISAALLMANLQASFRAFASEEVSPGTLVGKLNEVISSNIAADKFITFCYCMIDTTDNRLTYASAGHCLPILFHKSGEAVPLQEGGTPLAVFPDRKYKDAGLQLEPGDRLVLYTDGLTEAMNSDEQEFGERRLVELGSRNIALSASELLAAIKKEVVSFCNGSFQDDFTLVVVAVKSVRSGFSEGQNNDEDITHDRRFEILRSGVELSGTANLASRNGSESFARDGAAAPVGGQRNE